MDRQPAFFGTRFGLIFAAFFIFVVLLIAFAIITVQNQSISTTTVTVSSTTAVQAGTPSISGGEPVGPVSLEPAWVTVSSELSADYGADRLVDGDPNTAWRDGGLRGEDAVVTLTFEQPVTVFAVVLQGLADDDEFHRSYRIETLHLQLDGQEPTDWGVPDAADPFRIDLGAVDSSVITLEVLTTYPAESVDGQEPTDELAIAEIEVLTVAGHE